MKPYRLLLMCAICATACAEIPEIVSPDPPRIVIEGDEPIYRTRIGEPLTLSPTVENAGQDATYRWSIEGSVVGHEPEYTYVGYEAGQVYILFEVINDNGEDSAEMRIDVMPLHAPAIVLSVPEGGFAIATGQELRLTPSVENGDNAAFLWEVDGETAATTLEYTFSSTRSGAYTLRFTATNDDGSDSVEFAVTVTDPSQLPFSWQFEQTEYNVAQGRTLFIRPYHVVNGQGAEYSWTVNGEPVEPEPVDSGYAGAVPPCILAYTPQEQGLHTVTVTMRNGAGTVEQSFSVNCCPPEGTYRRSAQGTARFDRVYMYTPAPGQFINEGYTLLSPEEACAYAEEQMSAGNPVSLGAFGGCIVVGFDHSIANDGGYNIRVEGNAFTASSEPGIVWVMQDENGDSLPNDTWYELKGSEYGTSTTRLDYAVTYTRPASPASSVAWSDNEGETGAVDYLGGFHSQEYYYPAWIAADSYTLVGRRLEPRTEMVSESYWKNNDYEWGYADNFSATDMIDGSVNANHFRIDDAVTYDGKPAGLDYIDFVKIQTGVQSTAGWIGEVSTEVCGVSDYNMLK